MAYDKDAEMMYHTHLRKGDIGKYVFLPGDPFRTDLIASFLDDAKEIAHNREHKTWTGYLNGEKVSVVSTGMGCASAAICIEELIKVGGETFIRIGTAGRVNDASQDESLDGAICTAAVRDEGTTLHYIPMDYPAVASRAVVEALAQAAKDNNKNFIEGITQSKDSFYGEVDPDSSPIGDVLKMRWEAWRKSNVVCSEMEAAALFVIGSIRKVRCCAVMNFNEMETTIKVACDAVKILIEQDK